MTRRVIIAAVAAALLVVAAAPLPAGAQTASPTEAPSTGAAAESTFDGVIEGRIVNATEGGGEAGSAPLSLLTFRRMTREEERFGQADSQGRFHFEGLEVHSDMRYFVQAGYQDVAYRSPAVQIFPGAPSFTEVVVWETTTSDADIVIERASVAIPSLDENIGLLGVLEIITLQNEGDRTYVGDLFEDPVNGGAARISLPDNALDVNLGHGFGPDGFAAVPGGVINKAPVLPGPSEMIYGYTVAYTGTTAALERRYLYTARSVTVLMPDDVGALNSPQLEAVGPVEVSGEPHTLFTASDLPAGQVFELRLSDLPLFRDLSGGGLDFDSALRYVAVAVLGLVAAGALALALRRRAGAGLAADLNAAAPSALARERAGLVESLAALDAGFAAGQVPQAEYDRRRYAGKRRLVDVTLLLAEAAPREDEP